MHQIYRILRYTSTPCVSLPLSNSSVDILDDRRHTLGIKPMPLTKAHDLSTLRAAAFALDIEVMLAARTGCVGEIERRRQTPLTGCIHEIGVLARVIIPVAGEHVEHHPPECRGNIVGRRVMARVARRKMS